MSTFVEDCKIALEEVLDLNFKQSVLNALLFILALVMCSGIVTLLYLL